MASSARNNGDATGVSECQAVELTLSHELRVRGPRLKSSAPFFSCWFSHPDGDPACWWRIVCMPSSADKCWLLRLQLASTEERDSVFRKQPRHHLRPEHDAGDDELASPSQTNYILKTVSAKVIMMNPNCKPVVCQPKVLLNNNFAVLGYLNTLVPVDVCNTGVPVIFFGLDDRPGFKEEVNPAIPLANEKDTLLIIQASFTVEYHKVIELGKGRKIHS